MKENIQSYSEIEQAIIEMEKREHERRVKQANKLPL